MEASQMPIVSPLCSQPQAALRGGLLASVASVQCLGTTGKSPRCSASVLGGHITPEWMLHSNLRLLCGNHHGIMQLKGKLSKNKVFTGYRARTIRKQVTKSKNDVIRSIL